MNSTRTPRFIAFTLALMMTLTIFSGVTALSAPEYGAQLLVQTPGGTART